MAKKDKAVCTLTTSVLPRAIRAAFAGTNSFIPLSNSYKWVYADVTISNSTSDLLSASINYMGTTTALNASDKVLWISVKHSGTTDGSNKTSDGIILAFDNNNSLAYNTGDAVFIDSKEMFVAKLPFTTIGDLTTKSVGVTSGIPASTTPGSVKVNVAAIIQDVS